MIVENSKFIENGIVKIIRVCNECGKREEARLRVVYNGRKIRGEEIDLCASCAASRKYKRCKRGQEHHSWKHGLIRGYKRITLEDGRRIREHRYIYEQFLNRKITKTEVVHHIDLNTLKNSISNLILFKNHAEHKKCHMDSMENCALKFLNSKIWFNFKTNKYTLKYDEIFCKRSKIKIDLSIFGKKVGIKYPTYKVKRLDGSIKDRRCHTVIAEKIVDRKLYSDETVHHINGDYLNNDPNNLIVLNRRDHIAAHYSLQRCTAELLKMGFVGFNREKKEYFVKKAA